MIAEEAPVNGLAEQSAAANAHLQHTLTIVAYDPISDETMTWAYLRLPGTNGSLPAGCLIPLPALSLP